LRIAFVKDWRDVNVWGNEPVSWAVKPDKAAILKSWGGRPQNWGLISEGADVIIVNVVPAWYQARAMRLKKEITAWMEARRDWGVYSFLDCDRWFRRHMEGHPCEFGAQQPSRKYPAPSDINWSEYDVVICENPFLEAELTRQFPKTLFCYYDHERFWTYYQTHVTGKPYDEAYDLHLDHVEGPREFTHLPQTVYFPYVPGQGSVYQSKTSLLTDGRTLGENPQLSALGLVSVSGRLNAAEYFEKLAGCRYFVYVRNFFDGSGQAAIEAAAQGAIVIGYHWARPFKEVVHPLCQLRADYEFASHDHGPFGQGGCAPCALEDILKLCNDMPNLHMKILMYQNIALQSLQLRATEILEAALEAKRNDKH